MRVISPDSTEGVLLAAVEPVDLVAEEDRLPSQPAAVLRLPKDFPDALHPLGDGAEGHEFPVGVPRDDARQGRLS
jgi:hypothetical protein